MKKYFFTLIIIFLLFNCKKTEAVDNKKISFMGVWTTVAILPTPIFYVEEIGNNIYKIYDDDGNIFDGKVEKNILMFETVKDYDFGRQYRKEKNSCVRKDDKILCSTLYKTWYKDEKEPEKYEKWMRTFTIESIPPEEAEALWKKTQ